MCNQLKLVGKHELSFRRYVKIGRLRSLQQFQRTLSEKIYYNHKKICKNFVYSEIKIIYQQEPQTD